MIDLPKQERVRLREDERYHLDAYHLKLEHPESEVFSDKYMDELRQSILRIQQWTLKVGIAQAPAYIYLYVSIFLTAPAFSFYGVALGDVPGLKEILLLYITLLGLGSSLLDSAIDFRDRLYKHLLSVRFRKEEVQFFELLSAKSYYMQLRMPTSSKNFSVVKQDIKWFHVLSALLIAVVIALIGIMALVAQCYILLSIVLHPKLPIWLEIMICGTSVLLFAFSIIWRLFDNKKVAYTAIHPTITSPGVPLKSFRQRLKATLAIWL